MVIPLYIITFNLFDKKTNLKEGLLNKVETHYVQPLDNLVVEDAL